MMKRKAFILMLILSIAMVSFSNFIVNVSAEENWWMPLLSYSRVGDGFNCTCSVHKGNHNGQDFPAPSGTPVRATKSGTVVACYSSCTASHYNGDRSCQNGSSCGSKSMGNYVQIRHSDGTQSIYMHLSVVSISYGSYVVQGQEIGKVGSTGRSTGSHLHFGIKNSSGSYVNPMNYVDVNNPSSGYINCHIATGKQTYAINENVTFYFSADDANQMYITFYKDGLRRADLDINVSGRDSFTKSFSEQGNYEIYLYAVTENGDVSSERVSFSVLPLPDNVRLNIEKQHYSKGENISFFYSANNAANMYLTVFKDGERREDLDINISNTTHTSRKLYEAGQYDVFILATNSWGEAYSDYTTFYVDAGPSNIKVNTDKLIYSVNEYVNFSFSADNADQMYLTFYKDGIRRENLDVNVSGLASTSIKFAETGLYEAYICAVNSEGQALSRTKSFNVISDNKSYSAIHNGHTYIIFDAVTDWADANAECQRIGGHLATITSSTEQQFAESFINGRILTSYWIGATDIEKTGQWKWQNGESMNYTNWDTNEPNNAQLLEHYAAIYKQTGKWNDYVLLGDYSCGFICEFDYEYNITINFNANGGTTPIDTKSAAYFSTYGELPTPTKNGYSFLGWFTSDNGGEQITSDKKVTITGNQTLYAHWEYIQPHTDTQITKNGNTYNVSVEQNNLETAKIIVVGYKNNKFAAMEILNSDTLQTTFTGDFDTFKVMAWENLSTLKPLCEAETIPQSKWIIE